MFFIFFIAKISQQDYTEKKFKFKENIMPAKFTVYKDKANQFRFNLKAGNGEIIAVGESYPDKKSCLKCVASIQKNAPAAKIVDSTVEDTPKAAKPKPKTKAPVKPKAAKASAASKASPSKE